MGIVLVVASAYLQGCEAIIGGATYGVEAHRSLGGFFLQDEALERVIGDLTTDSYDAHPQITGSVIRRWFGNNKGRKIFRAAWK